MYGMCVGTATVKLKQKVDLWHRLSKFGQAGRRMTARSAGLQR
eukprot:COSAG02_NODE_54693_length_294_cov_2.005128_1_plen_42_part_01